MTFSGVLETNHQSDIEKSTTNLSQDKNIWANLLGEVHDQSSKRLPSGKSILILGDEFVGKSTLISKLKKDSETLKGYALEYHSMEVKDEEREGLWIGDSRCYSPYNVIEQPQIIYKDTNNCLGKECILSSLLINALSANNIADSMAVIVLSMSNPWVLIESLNKWLKFLENHINTKILSPKTQHYSQDKTSKYYKSKPDCVGDVEEPYHLTRPKYENLKNSLTKRFISYSEKEDGKSMVQTCNGHNSDMTQSQLSLLLQDENILTKNLGLPILVVVTKTDSMNELSKEYDFKNEHFDYIQQHLRKTCLSYGAGLIYTSCKENKNCDLLRQYILHLMYSFPFKRGPKIIDNDSIFIPIGWDSTKKIAILNEGLINIAPDSRFDEVLGSPPYKKDELRGPDLLAEEEQSFLSRMHSLLSQPLKNRNEIVSNRAASGMSVQKNISSRASPFSINSNKDKTYSDVNLSLTAATCLVSSSTTHMGTGTNIPPNNNTSSGGSTTAILTSSAGGGGIGALSNISESNSERVLTSFFYSLMNKKSSSLTPSQTQLQNTSANTSSTSLNTTNSPRSVGRNTQANALKFSSQQGSNNNTQNDANQSQEIGVDGSFSGIDNSCLSTTPVNRNSLITGQVSNNSQDADAAYTDEIDTNMSLNEMAEHLDRVSSSTPLKSDS